MTYYTNDGAYRDPRWQKIRDWRRGSHRRGTHDGCSGCDYCVPESKPGFKARMRRAWRREL